MILNRLYELAVREGLLDDPAFETQHVPYVIVLGRNGEFLDIEEQRGMIRKPARKKGGAAGGEVPDKGRSRSVPRPHGNTASQGFARYFVDTLPRVLPLTADEKSARSRATFWAQIREAVSATDDPSLRSVQAFGRRLIEDDTLVEELKRKLAEKTPDAGDRVTFACYEDGGPTILERPTLRGWYADFYRQHVEKRQTGGRTGFCTITGKVGPLPSSHPIKLSGIRGGLASGASIVSFDKPAFQHYGLDGAANAAIGYQAADGYARAFQWLQARPGHHLAVGNTLFLFWTRQPADTSFVMSLGEPSPEQVRQLLDSIAAGRTASALEDANDFYLLAVSGNAARVIVRDYLECPLGRVRHSIGKWFSDLSVANPSKEYQGRPTGAFPLWLLASATALDSDRVAPDAYTRLMRAALSGLRLPDSILAACLGRLRAEGSDGFHPARMGLIKLCLNRTHFRRENKMTDTLNEDETHPAYLYGRLLRIFEEIQYAALGSVNANVVDKFYGTFSAAPSLVLGRLMSNAHNHLRKFREDKRGAYVALDRLLTEVVKLLPPSAPPGTLPLADQGRFAVGYYHQKAKFFQNLADKKLAASAAEPLFAPGKEI